MLVYRNCKSSRRNFILELEEIINENRREMSVIMDDILYIDILNIITESAEWTNNYVDE